MHEINSELTNRTDSFVPRHDLSELELQSVEQDLKEAVIEKFGADEGVFAIWLGSSTHFANAVRTLEANQWPEMPEVMKEHENTSMFLAIFDTRNGIDNIVHAFRVSGAGFKDDNVTISDKTTDSDSTGIVLIDDVIKSGQGFTAEDFRGYCQDVGIDLSKCMSVETNFRVGKKAEKYNGLPLTQVGYIALFKLVESMDIKNGDAAIFASLNEVATISLGAIGAEFGFLAGRDDLRTPSFDEKGNPCFDDDYTLVCIPATDHNLGVFGNLTNFGAPQMTIK